jgi:hypothetical protein
VLVVVTEQFVVRNGISAGVERPKRLGHNLFIARTAEVGETDWIN